MRKKIQQSMILVITTTLLIAYAITTFVVYRQTISIIEDEIRQEADYICAAIDISGEAYLDQMEEEIRNYEAQNKTGNKVLDTLLTSKNLFCMKNHISMTSVVDGTLFDFMDVMDICSIFGNALDNAIECEKKIKDREKRLIHVSAFSQRNFLIIRFENYCENDLKFDAELPTTTKEDSQFHGYGLKSLRYTVRKYGGEVDINVQDNWFELKILIPMEMK